jgi:hypothetical protein
MRQILFRIIAAVFVIGTCEISAKVMVYLFLGLTSSDFLDYYTNDRNLTLVAWDSKYTVHPYFGYENTAIREFEWSRDKFTADDFVVGILGGSVAEQIGGYLVKYPAHFERLRAVIPSVSTKKIRIVNLAMGGVKQPQQFFMASYFSNNLDMVINIDGFNETGIDHLLPVYPLDFPFLSLKFYERTTTGLAYAALGRSATSAYKWINELPVRFSFLSRSSLYFGSWYGVRELLYRSIIWLNGQYYESAVAAYQSDDIREITPTMIMKERLDIWKRFTTMQYDLLTAREEKPTFFFIQPNQYLRGSKILSDEELEIAIDEQFADLRHEQMTFVRAGYSDLRKSGIPIFDMTKVFLGYTDTVYKDNCCHLNGQGIYILTQAIVSSILEHQGVLPIAACDAPSATGRCLD